MSADDRAPWFRLFLGNSPGWYKRLVLACLVGNALLLGLLRLVASPEAAGFAVGWLMLAQFILFLAMALKCHPLLPGGLLALEAVALGLTSSESAWREAGHGFPVFLLVVFVVAGVSMLKEWLSLVFTRLLFATRSKVALSLLFCGAGALLSAFLDALTVIAVVATVFTGFWEAYNTFRSAQRDHDERELEEFRGFLRSLVMHAAIGTAIGGVMTVVGEPQNLLIAHVMRSELPGRAAHWDFGGFFMRMGAVTVPTAIAGLLTCALAERFRAFGYGARIPERVRELLERQARERAAARTPVDRWRLRAQAACAALLVAGLAFHVSEVGLLGLGLIVLAAASTGIDEEHRLGHAFLESMPFAALLVVFFIIVAVIGEQRLFAPVVAIALDQGPSSQVLTFFCANAVLSAVSDNVFVASVFIHEARGAFQGGHLGADQFERLAIATNCGTNIPSVATPNGQAAFLFLLTGGLAGPIRLGYGRMVLMALPFTVVLTVVSLGAVMLLVAPR